MKISRPLWAKVVGTVSALVAALALLLVFFPWDWLRGPVNRYVSEKTGRHFEIVRRLDVKLGRTTRVIADGIVFANPAWAKDPYLVKAEGAEISVRLLPLFKRRIELPLVQLHKPEIGLQVEADGRKTWALGRDTADKGNLPKIGALVVDEGSVRYVATHEGADIRTDFTMDGPLAGTAAAAQTNGMPLHFRSKGTWQKAAFTAEGRTGSLVSLSAPLQQPFPAQLTATAGSTTLRAKGSITSLATLDGVNASFELQGQNLAELYKLVGVVLPETPRYAVRGQLFKQGEVWHVTQINGKLGQSDLGGELAFDRSLPVPLLTGQVQSKALDFDDLAPLVGLQVQGPGQQPKPPETSSANATATATAQANVAAAVPTQTRRAPVSQSPGRKVLPIAMLDVTRLKAMNADVRYSAAQVTNVRQLPLERMSAHVILKDGVLRLDPMDLGVAGGKLTGRLRIDGRSNPAVAQVNLDARALELGKLFPGFKLTQASFGKIHGEIDLTGRGNSVAQMLGTSSGNVAMLMGSGQISNLLMEVAGLDGAEIIKFMLGGDRNIQLRCGATSFDVSNGLMRTRAFMLDTADTVVYGTGTVSLATEAIDLTLRPYPKDVSIFSLRSPLKVSGSFAAPKAGVDKAALAGRAGVAIALAAINPLLALAATIETGPGKDADCGAALREAAAPDAAARVAASVPPSQPPRPGSVLGAPPAGGAAASSPQYPLEKRSR